MAPEADALQSGRMPPTLRPTSQLSSAVGEDCSMAHHGQSASTSDMPSRTPPAVTVKAAGANITNTAVAVCGLLMQHSNSSRGSAQIIDSMAVCKLLATSKALWPLVYQHCSGRLQLTLRTRSPEQLHQFCCWFKKHAGLLRTLDLMLPETQQHTSPQVRLFKPFSRAELSGWFEPVNLEDDLAAAFVAAGHKAAAATAAATATGAAAVRLGPANTAEQQPGATSTASTCVRGQQVTCTTATATASATATAANADVGLLHLEDISCHSNLSVGSANIVLQNLQYCSNLRALKLNILCDKSTDSTSRDNTITALGQLHSLTSLEVTPHPDKYSCADEAAFERLLPYLSGFSRLKFLKIPKSDRYGNFKCLPVSLEKLQLDVYGMMPQFGPPLMLTHLTALTELVIQGYRFPESAAVAAQDRLPESLMVLRASDCPIATPLLPLKSLKELALAGSTTQAEETYKMSQALTSLTCVKLSYSAAVGAPPLGAELPTAWATLPIRKLALHHGTPGMGGHVNLPTLQRIGQLTQLTCLSFQEGRESYFIEASPRQLGDCLSQLTNLQDLALCGVELESELRYCQRLRLVGQSLVGLSNLTSLNFWVRTRAGHQHADVPDGEYQRRDKQAVLKHIASLTQLQSLTLHTWHLAYTLSLDQLSSLQQLATLKLWQHDQGSGTQYSVRLTHAQQNGLHDLMGKLCNLKMVELVRLL